MALTTIFLQILCLVAVSYAIWKVQALSARIQSLKTHNDRMIENSVQEIVEELQNVGSLSALNLRFPVFYGGPSIDGTHGRLLVQQLISRRPKTIVEIGSGTSTIVIARVMQILGIEDLHHVSIDHEEYFLEISKRYAEANEVASRIKFSHCPLGLDEKTGLSWYSGVEKVVGSRAIELLVIDGPPAYEQGKETAREPALDILYRHLATNCVVILDDANRPGERSVVSNWMARYPEFRLRRIESGKGMVVLER